ncbi:MAG TPA: MauE/DoxX family redox-associated membrane protein [Phycisphaerae bacterium]|nr:MauE/DoxX family redox-associated membrane protein [Phycisphaerae bacterium]
MSYASEATPPAAIQPSAHEYVTRPTEARRSGTWRLIAHFCALAVGGVFLFAAQSKIVEPRQFIIDIKNYRMVPEAYLHLVALLMPWWEVGAALALIFPRTRRAGAILISGMLLLFIAAVSYAALYKGYNISCGCFGKGSAAAGWKTIALDTGLLIATLVSLIGAGPRPSGAAAVPPKA